MTLSGPMDFTIPSSHFGITTQFQQIHPALIPAEESRVALMSIVTRPTASPASDKPTQHPRHGTPHAHPSPSPTGVSQERQLRESGGVHWPTTLWLLLLHVGALAAPFFFSWSGLILTLVLHWVAGGIGVCLGYHRLLTHDSFRTYRPIKLFIAWVGGFAGEGTAIDWVANHRKHHAFSDKEGDPHSPHDGGFWSHAGWLAYSIHGKEGQEHAQHWAPDLANDRGLRMIGYLFLPTQFLVGAVLLAAGYSFGGWYLGLSWLAWGLFLRLTFVLHSTWFVNSASHMWGYRNYETTDDSRNNWWVALLTYGEGWHNNHHAYPRMAKHGHRWWELDVTFLTIHLMQRLGLAWDVVDYKNQREKRKND